MRARECPRRPPPGADQAGNSTESVGWIGRDANAMHAWPVGVCASCCCWPTADPSPPAVRGSTNCSASRHVGELLLGMKMDRIRTDIIDIIFIFIFMVEFEFGYG